MQTRLLERPSLAVTATADRGSAASLRGGRCLLFLSVWLLYGVLVQSKNQHDFGLQQMGVEAIVERGRFYLEGSPTPELQPLGDVFEYRGHLYAAKQPGQFMAGALVYALLYLCGLSYLTHFTLTAALVTFLTASLVTAAAALAVFELARGLAGSRASVLWPLGTALTFALGTTAMPYAGIAHHDALASGYLVIAFYCVFRLAQTAASCSGAWAAGAGLFLGLTVTTSMLPFFMAVIAGLYFFSLRQWQRVPQFLAGGVLGLLPLLAYNALSFGNPFLMPNIAGSYSDTYFALEWANFTAKSRFYATMLTHYAPVCWCGLAGIAFFPRIARRERIALLALLTALAAYVLNIDTVGHCQYGPRYLLPLMPFAALGLIGFSHLAPRASRWAAGALLLVGLFSVATNVVGAMGGAMYCQIQHYAFPRYLATMASGQLAEFPLAHALALPLAIVSGGLGFWAYSQQHSGAAPLLQPYSAPTVTPQGRRRGRARKGR
jgi:hypothetical protein